MESVFSSPRIMSPVVMARVKTDVKSWSNFIPLDEISFPASDKPGQKIIINKDYVKKNLGDLVRDTDLSKFIL